jgi:hypothetical protein
MLSCDFSTILKKILFSLKSLNLILSASSGNLFEKKHCCLETKNSCNIDFKQFLFGFNSKADSKDLNYG